MLHASRAVFALLCTLLSISSPASNRQKPIPSATDDEYAIYSLIIRTRFAEKEVTKIVIQDRAGTPGILTAQMADGERQFEAYVRKMLPEVQAATVADFKGNGKEAGQLEKRFSINVPYFLVTSKEISEIFHARGDAWNDFYKKYPGAQGILSFSRVGFDRRRDQALVYYGNQAAWLGGAGYLVLLAKTNGSWVIVKTSMLWIS